jgi:hypothetical protein
MRRARDWLGLGTAIWVRSVAPLRSAYERLAGGAVHCARPAHSAPRRARLRAAPRGFARDAARHRASTQIAPTTGSQEWRATRTGGPSPRLKASVRTRTSRRSRIGSSATHDPIPVLLAATPQDALLADDIYPPNSVAYLREGTGGAARRCGTRLETRRGAGRLPGVGRRRHTGRLRQRPRRLERCADRARPQMATAYAEPGTASVCIARSGPLRA